jgi:energy-coupling factor transporter ATP-binding protein EcfA2
MNILQLQLLAFGVFTNKILDFSAKQPGFHLIYGPNEAGKSTLRRALINLFSYLHPNNQLLFYRRKGRKNTLLDVDNKPLNEKYLLDYFGGDIDESLFEAGSGSGRIVVPDYEEQQPLKTIVYARVSSHKQKDDLERQAERMVNFCISNGWQVESVIKEIASGLNDNRPKLIKILKNKYPIRIGYNYLSTLINGEIVIANLAEKRI